MARIFNFSAGPAVLPEEVLARAGDEMLDWRGSGMCVMEMSHRGKEFMSIAAEAEKDLRELLAIPQNYKVLFLQGGATLQFAQIPMNLLAGKGKADYVVTGEWSKKAIKEAQAYCDVHIAASPRTRRLRIAPRALERQADTAYCTTARTKRSAAWKSHWIPKSHSLVADASSHILSRPLDVSKFGLIYAGAQKNIGPAGLTIVIVRDDLLGKAQKGTPTADGLTAAAAAGFDAPSRPATYASTSPGWCSSGLRRKGWLVPRSEQRIIAKAEAAPTTILDAEASFSTKSMTKKDATRMIVPFTACPTRSVDDDSLKGAEEGVHGWHARRDIRLGRRHARPSDLQRDARVEGVEQLVGLHEGASERARG
jgi:phosphoserine aminotransferase